MIVIGSTTASPIDLAQLCLTAEQAINLGALIVSAGQDALVADRNVERLRKHGPAAMRLCFVLAAADDNDVLVDQSRVRLGFSQEAQEIAEQAYLAIEYTGDWRAAWRNAGERVRKLAGVHHG